MDAQQQSAKSDTSFGRERFAFALASICFLISGFAGLLYETVWFRQFAAVFGTSEAALGAVLAGYMGGLALGAVLAAQWIERVRRPVLVYGVLELGVALGAIAVPFGLQIVNVIRIALCGGQPELPESGGFVEVLVDSTLACLLILVPTGCMGATLPLLARHVSTQGRARGASRIGFLYAINTAGGVLGTLVAAFVLLPQMGLQSVVFCGVAANVLVFGLAVILEKCSAPYRENLHIGTLDSAARNSQSNQPTISKKLVFDMRCWMILIAVSGAASFTYEVLWTRLLSHVLGGSIFSFATMLSAFLIGIAAGSAYAGRLIAKGASARRAFGFAQIGAAIGALAMFAAVDLIPAVGQWCGAGPSAGAGANVLISLAVLLPSTFAIGMTLPLAISAASEVVGGAGRGCALPQITGRLYASGTMGAIVGAMVCGHLFLPGLGFRMTVGIAAAANLLIAAVVFCPMVAARPRIAIGFATAIVAAMFVPLGGPDEILRRTPLANKTVSGRIVYSAAGSSSTVTLIQRHDGFKLFTNGLPEADIAPRGAVAGAEAGLRWLTALPILARPEADSVLVIGFGGGGAVSGIPGTVRDIDSIELESKVIEAVKSVADVRMDDPLADSRLRLVFNDARGALGLTSKRYDAIVSQPSHPWTAGASHLYTREFLQLAKSRLSKDGVFLQWMNAQFIDRIMLKSIGATLIDVFPHVRVYQPHTGTLLFLASEMPLDVERQIVRTGLPLRRGLPELRWLGLNDVHDVAATLAIDHDGLVEFCRDAPVNTDNRNLLATRSASARKRGLGADAEIVFADFEPLLNRPDHMSLLTELKLDAAQIVRRLTRMGMRRRASTLAAAQTDVRTKSLALGYLASYAGEPNAQDHFVRALNASPGDPNASFKLLEAALPQLARNDSRDIVQVSHQFGRQSTIVEATMRFARKDWAGLQSLDGRLATIDTGAALLPLALTFRAAWRTKVSESPEAADLAREAIVFADRALAIEPTVFAGTVRLDAAGKAGDTAAYLESAAFLINLFQTQPHAASRSMVRRITKRVLSETKSIRTTSNWMEARVEFVRGLYEEAQRQASDRSTAHSIE